MLIYVVTKSVQFPLNARYLRNLLEKAYARRTSTTYYAKVVVSITRYGKHGSKLLITN